MIKTIIGILMLGVLVAGCQTTAQPLVRQQFTVVTPSDSMYYCPTVRTFPNPDGLTDIQVARLIVQLHSNNLACKRSIDAIRQFLKEAQEQIEKTNRPPT